MEIELHPYETHIDKLWLNNNYIGIIWMDITGDYFFESDKPLDEKSLLKVCEVLKSKREIFDEHIDNHIKNTQ